jgi:hypothetical protein
LTDENIQPEEIRVIRVSVVEVIFTALIRENDVLYPWDRMLNLFMQLQELNLVRFHLSSRNDLLKFVEAYRSTLSQTDIQVELCYNKVLPNYETSIHFVDIETTQDLQ